MVGVILAAGYGTRMKDSTGEECCKTLKKVNDKHLIEFSLDNLITTNVSKAFIVVGKDGKLIEETIGTEYNGLSITYVYQPQQKGLINAFVAALNAINTNDDVVLQLADEIFSKFRSSEVKKVVHNENLDFCCGITYESDPQKIKANYSVETDENYLIKHCTEKPHHVTNNIKGTGFCVFKKSALSMLKNMYDETSNTPGELCDYINMLIANGQIGVAFCLAEKEFNINTFSDLKEAIVYYSSMGR